MKKGKDCEVEMIENTSLHTNCVGGVSKEEKLMLNYCFLGNFIVY